MLATFQGLPVRLALASVIALFFAAGCSNGRQLHLDDAGAPDTRSDRPASPDGALGGSAGRAAGGGGAPGGAATGGSTGGAGGTASGGQGGNASTKTATGLACKADGDCDSGHCASGVCCKETCSGACMACTNILTVSLADGACGPVGSGLKDPNAACAADSAACGKTGFCDGKGQCEQRGSTTSCGTASCGGGSYTPAAYCDGKGACSTVTPQDCKGFTCSTTGGCAITCSADAECTGGYCAPLASGATTRSCAPKKSDGVACAADNQCTNGHCVSGICCQSACTTKCFACSKAATGQDDGLCKSVLAGGASQGMCTTSGGECGQDGTCDGNGGCRLAKQGTSCGTKAAACVAGNMSAAVQVCNGAGACASPSSQACGNYVCNTATGACKQAPCSGDGDCITGYYCNGSACVAKKAVGGTCGSQHECANGTCSADGHCCDATCSASCPCQSTEYCSPTGVCTPRNGLGSRCEGDQECQSNACAAGDHLCCPVACAGSCTGGICCAGSGLKFCGGSTCKNTNTDNSNCGGCGVTCNQTCAGGMCKKSDGASCSSPGECGSGICTQYLLDKDGDGYGNAAIQVGMCGTAVRSGFVIMTAGRPADCCDDDGGNQSLAKLINPGADFQRASAGGVCGITWDYNCDGAVSYARTTCGAVACSTTTPVAGADVAANYCQTSGGASPGWTCAGGTPKSYQDLGCGTQFYGTTCDTDCPQAARADRIGCR